MQSKAINYCKEALTFNESNSDNLQTNYVSATLSYCFNTLTGHTKAKVHKCSTTAKTTSFIHRKKKRSDSDRNFDLPSYNKLNNEDFINNNFYEQHSSSSSSEINSEFVQASNASHNNEDTVIKLKNDLMPNKKIAAELRKENKESNSVNILSTYK